MKLSFNYTHATVVKNGNGKFHPAITNRDEISYWPNRTFDDHDAALLEAKLALNDALARAQHVCDTWNITASRSGLEV